MGLERSLCDITIGLVSIIHMVIHKHLSLVPWSFAPFSSLLRDQAHIWYTYMQAKYSCMWNKSKNMENFSILNLDGINTKINTELLVAGLKDLWMCSLLFFHYISHLNICTGHLSITLFCDNVLSRLKTSTIRFMFNSRVWGSTSGSEAGFLGNQ